MDYKYLRELLKKDGYISVNKKLANSIGLFETIILADLMSKEEYFEEKNKLDKDGYFYNSRENIKTDTTLSAYKQRNAITKLKKMGLIKTKEAGMPKTTHYKIFYRQLLSFLTTSCKETKPLDVKKLNINNNNKIIIRNNKYNKIKNLTDEVCKEISDQYQVMLPYVLEKRMDLKLYCQSKGKRFKNYKATLMNWIRRDIKDDKAPKKSINQLDEEKTTMPKKDRDKILKALNKEKKKLLDKGLI